MSKWPPPQIAELPGQRLHLQHGPIDLVIKAEGGAAEIDAAYAAAIERFGRVLPELVAELAVLRRRLVDPQPDMLSPVARVMVAACWPYRAAYITPMAAVAGSVADDIRTVMLHAAPSLHSLYVNNGGDISLYVAPGESLKIGMVPDLAKAIPEGVLTITSGSGVGGIATSGCKGRSFSRGIADAVTVLARSAADADAAATMIANAVNADDREVKRAPASSLDPDSDLGDLPVTTAVGILPLSKINEALVAGESMARELLANGRIAAAALVLQGSWRVVQAQTGLLRPLP